MNIVWFFWRAVSVCICFGGIFDHLVGLTDYPLVWICGLVCWVYVGSCIESYESRKRGWKNLNRWE